MASVGFLTRSHCSCCLLLELAEPNAPQYELWKDQSSKICTVIERSFEVQEVSREHLIADRLLSEHFALIHT